MNDRFFMSIAYKLACKAFEEGEVPVGALIVKDGEILSQAYNKRESEASPLAHAEVIAIQEACRKQGDWRLTGGEIYVTLEPCLMCMSLILESRIERVIYACPDLSIGICRNHLAQIQKLLPHHNEIRVLGGVESEKCSQLLKDFFQNKRALKQDT